MKLSITAEEARALRVHLESYLDALDRLRVKGNPLTDSEGELVPLLRKVLEKLRFTLSGNP
jgi:hypothetical protein